MLIAEAVRGSADRGAPLKRALNVVALLMAAPCAATIWLAEHLGGQGASQSAFAFWAQLFAQLPGVPGRFLRRAYYRCTLEHCAADVTIEFGTLFSRRSAVLENGVYIGAYALIGSAHIGANSLIGSRVSLLSGGAQHRWLPSGHWSQTEPERLIRIRIGPDAWIGEGAIVMADAGAGTMVAAGAVVSAAVPPHTMVAGNPARFVRRIGEPEPGPDAIGSQRP